MAVFTRPKTTKPGQQKHWHYEFRVRGVRYRGALPEARTKWEAEQAEIKLRRDIFERKYEINTVEIPLLSHFIDKTFLPWSKANKASWKHDEFRCRVLKMFFAGKRLCDITPLLAVSFVNARLKSQTVRKEELEDGTRVNSRRSPTTVRKEVALLSEIFNRAIDEEIAFKNPCRKLPKSVLARIPARNRRERFLSHDEERSSLSLALWGVVSTCGLS